jgi:Flp pilus assembly protein protease CpaA
MLEPSILIPAALLAVGALFNFWRGLVPNWLVLSMVGAFPIYALSSGMALGDFGWHLLAFLITLAVVLLLFVLGLMGGGAGKLLSATVLWLPPSAVSWFLLLAVGVGVLILIASQFMSKKPASLMASRFAGVVATLGALFLVVPAA